MDKEELKKKLKELGINQTLLAIELGVSRQQITNWNKKGVYPNYVDGYFDSLKDKEEIKKLRQRINNFING